MLLALLAWVWVAGSALARDRPASERFAVGALAACALAWTAMVAGALGVGLLGSTLAMAGLALAAAAACAGVAAAPAGAAAGGRPARHGLRGRAAAERPTAGAVAGRAAALRAATCSGTWAGSTSWRAGPPPRAASMPASRTATRGCSMRWWPGSPGRCRAGRRAPCGRCRGSAWPVPAPASGCWQRRSATAGGPPPASVGLFLAAASLGWAADGHGHRVRHGRRSTPVPSTAARCRP